jgi:hypothetical protein
MRLVQELVELFEQKRSAAEISEAASAFIANHMPAGGQLNMLQRLSGPKQPYAEAKRAQLRQMGYGALCVLAEQADVVA